MTNAVPESSTPEQAVTEAAVLEALSRVNDPELKKPLTELGMIQNLRICGGNVAFEIVLTTTACPLKGLIQAQASEAVKKLPGVENVTAEISGKTLTVQARGQESLRGIKNIIAVSSGKGGVGKTTVAVNLACALAKRGASVGILDADIYGPNVPLMMGLPGSALKDASQKSAGENPDGKALLAPPSNHGVKVMSMAFLLKDDQPVVWRGPMLDKVIRQFLSDSDWGELDYLIVDLPPGTGDAQLTIIQSTPVVGAVIVTTPQEVALLDSRKGLAMFRNANIPVFGLVENMSYFINRHGEREDIFGAGGGRRAAEALGVPLLGEVPLVTVVREKADQGAPIVIVDSENPAAQVLQQVADQIVAQVCELGVQSRASSSAPTACAQPAMAGAGCS